MRIRSMVLASVAGLGLSCLSPTEILLDVSTDVDCTNVRGTSFFVGPNHVTDAPACNAGEIGTLVLIPSGAGQRVEIRVVTGLVGSRCDVDATSGCIEARRALQYVPHTPLKLPIHMESTCLNVACAPNLTCVNGTCVDSTIDENACDGGVCPLVDAGVCVADVGFGAGTPLVVLHFDEGTGATTQDALHTLAPITVPAGVSWSTTGAPSCNTALQFDGTAWLDADATPLDQLGAFTVSAWIKIAPLPTAAAFDVMNDLNFAGFRFAATSSGLELRSCSFPSGGCATFTGTKAVDDGAWHFVAASRSTSGLSVCVDGACETGVPQPPIGSASGTLTIGDVQCCDVDSGSCMSCAPGGFTGILDELHVYPAAL